MLHIKKGRIPSSFLTFSQKDDAHFDTMPTDVKQELRESLWREQGGICAYCMKKIEANGTSMKIEHFQARNEANELVYKNLLAVCHGGDRGLAEHQTCDTRKGDKELHVSPLDKATMQRIYYSNGGEIFIDDSSLQQELNLILNLNDEDLIYNRQKVLRAYQRGLKKFKRRFNNEFWKKEYNRFSTKKDGCYLSYVGILLWYISKKYKGL